MSTLLSMRAYARLRGVTVEAVSKAVRKGRISTVLDANGDRKIDPEIADREWAANSDPTKFRSSGPAASQPAPEPPAPASPDSPKGPSVHQSAAVLKAYQARLAKLEFEEKSGKVVDAEDVRKKWISICALIRTKVLGIPSKSRQRIPELTADQYTVLETIVRETLEDLADGED